MAKAKGKVVQVELNEATIAAIVDFRKAEKDGSLTSLGLLNLSCCIGEWTANQVLAQHPELLKGEGDGKGKR